MYLHEKLKLLRKERGLTQSDVGAAIGQERSTIACYETGKRTPDVATLDKLAKLYKVTLDHFSEKSEADVLVELLSRSNSFFSANDVSAETKSKAMNTIMRLYLENTTKEESILKNDEVFRSQRQDNPITAETKARQDKTVRY